MVWGIVMFEASGRIGVFHAGYYTEAAEAPKLVDALEEQRDTAGL